MAVFLTFDNIAYNLNNSWLLPLSKKTNGPRGVAWQHMGLWILCGGFKSRRGPQSFLYTLERYQRTVSKRGSG